MAEAETKYQPALTAREIMVLSGVQNTDPGSILATKPQGVGLVEAISAAKGAAGVKLPTQPIDAAAKQSISAATIAHEQLMQGTAAAIEGLKVEQLRKDDAFTNLRATIQSEGVQKGIIADNKEEIEARNLRIAADSLQNINGVIARGAIEASQRAETVQNLLDERQAIREEPGFIGFLKRRFLAAGVNSDINANVEELNTLNSMQTDLISQAAEVAKVRTAILPTKTPEQIQAERQQLHNATATDLNKATLENAKSREDYFAKTVQFQNEASTAASGEAVRKITISMKNFDAEVHAIIANKDGKTAVAQFAKLEEEMGDEANRHQRIENAMGLKPGEGKGWINDLKKLDPEVAATVYQVAYSGRAEDPAAFAKAQRYIPQDMRSPNKEAIAEQVIAKAGNFEAFLAKSNSGAKSMDEFKKLPPALQSSLQNAFHASPDGEVLDPIINANFSDLAASIQRSVPNGSILIPATETSAAKSIKLRDTGELGKQLANLKGDGAAAIELAKIQVLEAGRKPDEVAKELYNFVHNAATVKTAYQGNDRTQFGLPPMSSWPQEVAAIQGMFPYEKATAGKSKLDLLSYPQLLSFLVKAKTAASRKAMYPADTQVIPLDKANLFGAP